MIPPSTSLPDGDRLTRAIAIHGEEVAFGRPDDDKCPVPEVEALDVLQWDVVDAMLRNDVVSERVWSDPETGALAVSKLARWPLKALR